MARYSILISTHRRPQLLARAILSVKRQEFSDVSVVVVSDERSPDTYTVAQACLSGDDIYMERGGQPGPAFSRTLAMAAARSEHVIFLDDDDELSPGYLASAERHRAAAPGDILFTDFYIRNDGEDRIAASQVPPVPVTIGNRDPQAVYVQNFIPNSSLVFPIESIGGKTFDESLVLNEDWDFLLNAMQGRRLTHCPVFGPIIHKSDRSMADRRGAVNDHLLPDTLKRIYRKWPAPTPALRAARQSLFASAGISLPIEEC